MKLKPTFFIVFCLLLTACSCDNDDENIKSVALSETNYVFESDLYVYALNTEKQQLLDYLENPNDPNYDDVQAEEAETRIVEINQIIESKITGVMRGFPPIPPPPPPPIPCLCFDVWNQLEFMVKDNSTLGFEATITNENQETVFYVNSLGEAFHVLEYGDDLKAFKFENQLEGYSGPAFLTITKLNEDQSEISYSVPLLIGNAQ